MSSEDQPEHLAPAGRQDVRSGRAEAVDARPELSPRRPPRTGRARLGSEEAPAQSSAQARPARGPASPAGLIALVLFAWGQSLLLYDLLRRNVFEPHGGNHLVLVLPFFGGAVVAGVVAVLARGMGRSPLGGSVVHRFGIASALLGLLGVFFVVWFGPAVQEAEQRSRELRASRQVDGVADALERYRRYHGGYPPGSGVGALRAALVPDVLPASFALHDPWGNPLVYRAIDGGFGYLLLSTGEDGFQDHSSSAYLATDDAESEPAGGDDLVLISGRATGRLLHWLLPGQPEPPPVERSQEPVEPDAEAVAPPEDSVPEPLGPPFLPADPVPADAGPAEPGPPPPAASARGDQG